MELNTIKCIDCIKGLNEIEDESVDLTFADSPFNLNKKYAASDDAKEEKEYINWCEEWISELVRITKLTGSIFIHNIPKWLTHYAAYMNKCDPCKFNHWISWDSPSGSSSKKNCLQPTHYGILYYSKGEENKFYKLRYPLQEMSQL